MTHLVHMLQIKNSCHIFMPVTVQQKHFQSCSILLLGNTPGGAVAKLLDVSKMCRSVKSWIKETFFFFITRVHNVLCLFFFFLHGALGGIKIEGKNCWFFWFTGLALKKYNQ